MASDPHRDIDQGNAHRRRHERGCAGRRSPCTSGWGSRSPSGATARPYGFPPKKSSANARTSPASPISRTWSSSHLSAPAFWENPRRHTIHSWRHAPGDFPLSLKSSTLSLPPIVLRPPVYSRLLGWPKNRLAEFRGEFRGGIPGTQYQLS